MLEHIKQDDLGLISGHSGYQLLPKVDNGDVNIHMVSTNGQ